MAIALPIAAQTTEQAGASAPVLQCNEQQPIDYLVRGNWVVKARQSREEQQARRELAQKAIRFRTEHYGYFEGFGRSEWNPHPPLHYARSLRVFGRPVRLHERI